MFTARQRDYSARLVGHVNMATDIKEANFIFGDRFVAVGSDDGCVYIYDAHTGRLLQRIEHADPDVVNCVQGHPFEPVVASSGIAHCIKLWTPTADTPRPMPLATVAARQVGLTQAIFWRWECSGDILPSAPPPPTFSGAHAVFVVMCVRGSRGLVLHTCTSISISASGFGHLLM